MNKWYLLTLVIIVSSCNLLRNVDNKKKKTDLTENLSKQTTRIGDTVRYTLPLIKYKDTTIYTVNRQGTTLKTVFDRTGNVSEIECMSSMIDELIQMNRRLLEDKSDRVTENEFTGGINWTFIALGGMAIIGIIVFKKL